MRRAGFDILYRIRYNIIVGPFRQGGGDRMDIFLSLLISVIAGIIAYYICKWLDKPTKRTPRDAPRGVHFWLDHT